MNLNLRFFSESFPLAKVFRISRGAKTSAEVIVVVITDGKNFGWGEAVPYNRYNETIETVSKQLLAVSKQLQYFKLTHSFIASALPAGSARNALDCALWDYLCKVEKKHISELINITSPNTCITAQTLSVDRPEAMQQEATHLANAKLVKVKLDAESVVEKMQMIALECPNSQFIIDANEAWSFELLQSVVEPLKALNVALIEQPLPDTHDASLIDFNSPIPLCADESFHTANDIVKLKQSYDYINIKLDKTGGLTEALKVVSQAKLHNMGIMVGCMVGTSLAMAPAFSLCANADFVDLDGPLIVANDRPNGFTFDNGDMLQGDPFLWGQPKNSCLTEKLENTIFNNKN